MDLKIAAKAARVRGVRIAAELGVSEATVSRWLNGGGTVPTKYVRPLARLLRINPVHILPKPTKGGSRGQRIKRYGIRASACG